jgi:uncharacterized damage-inducible protein DinB
MTTPPPASVDLRYPTGRFVAPTSPTAASRAEAIGAIARMPALLRAAVAGLDDAQLDTPYRPEGWTVRQLVHHVADSHVNAYVRMKLAVTEETPAIKTYEEKQWAELEEARTMPPEISLALLEALHARWAAFLRTLTGEQFSRTVRYPDGDRLVTLDTLVALYAWHGAHHVAHVTELRRREGWATR